MRPILTVTRGVFLALIRDRGAVIGTLGIALISMLLFGWLFGGGGSTQLRLGLADEDGMVETRTVVSGFLGVESGDQRLQLVEGGRAELLEQLQHGRLDAVIVFPAGFAAGLSRGDAEVLGYFNRANAIAAAVGSAVVQSLVTDLNQRLAGAAPAVRLTWEASDVRSTRAIDFLTPGLLGMMLMWGNTFVGATLVSFREQGLLRRFGVTPVGPARFLAGLILAHLAFSLVQATVFLGLARLAFQVGVPVARLGALAALVFLGALALLAVGLLIGAISRTSDGARALGMLVAFPMMFLGGSYFPTSGAPDFLQPVIRALPLTHLNEALRRVFLDGWGLGELGPALLVLGFYLLVGFAAASRALRWDAA